MGGFFNGPDLIWAIIRPTTWQAINGPDKYGSAFGPKHGSQLMGRPTRVLKILWAYSWAGPLMSAKSHGPLTGPAHYDPQESYGPLPGPAHYGTQKSCGPLPGLAHYGPQNLVGL